MLQHIIQFPLYLSSCRLGEVKTKESFKLSALKVVERCSLTKGSNYSDLAGKRFVYA